MSKLWITELHDLAGVAQAAQYPALVNQAPLTLGASQRSAAFGANTKYLQLYCGALCHYVVAAGGSHSATVNDTPIPAGSIFYIGVKPGDSLAVIVGA